MSLPKPVKRKRINRSSPEYRNAKQAYLKLHEQWGGWWECNHCGKSVKDIELDHIDRTGMGGSPSRLLDTSNWQLLCRDCHDAKDGGMK